MFEPGEKTNMMNIIGHGSAWLLSPKPVDQIKVIVHNESGVVLISVIISWRISSPFLGVQAISNFNACST